MKYVVLIMDGAAGYPISSKGGKTSLELASIPHLDALAREGIMGLALNVPEGMEPSSAVACLSLMGYDPRKYYSGRGPIEARSMGIALAPGEVAFRCNLVTLKEGMMKSYSSGHITDAEAAELIAALNDKMADSKIRFFPGVSYRHILTVKDGAALLKSTCIPPHDISDRYVSEFRPKGEGSLLLNNLITRSEEILRNHPVNIRRVGQGKLPATSIWLFWGGKKVDDLPPFGTRYQKKTALTSGVDLLRGIAALTGIDILQIPGVTGGLDTDYDSQINGVLEALEKYDVVIVHVESPDEAGHAGSLEEKVKALEAIDSRMVARLREYKKHHLRLMILPDHPTPIAIKTHTPEAVPFLLHGPGFDSTTAAGYSEKEAAATGFFVNEGHSLMSKFIFT